MVPAFVPRSHPTYGKWVLRRYRFALGPGWILLHLFTVAAMITMIMLGRWQLHVSESKHFDIQNFGYTIQWWLFSAFVLLFWWRIIRDHARRREAPTGEVEPAADADRGADRTAAAEPEPAPVEPVAYRRYVPPAAPPPVDDPVHAAYNEYLAQLAARDAEERSR